MIRSAKLRVVIDTNLFISGIIAGQGLPSKLLQAWRDGIFILIISEILIGEMKTVLWRPRIQKEYKIGSAKITQMTDTLKSGAELVRPASAESLSVHCRDAKDDLLLATSIAGQADYLVTGDKDLLVLNGDTHLGKSKIVTARKFLDLEQFTVS